MWRSFELRWLWIFPRIKLSLHSGSMWDKIGWLYYINSETSYLPLIKKDSITHMHGNAAYVKEGLPFAWDMCLENSVDSYLCFQLALLNSVSYFFFLYWSPSSYLYTVLDSISSNTNEVLSINPSANVFFFVTLTFIIRTG